MTYIATNSFDDSFQQLKNIAKLRYYYLFFLKDECKKSDIKCSNHLSEFSRYLNIISNLYKSKYESKIWINSKLHHDQMKLWNDEFISLCSSNPDYNKIYEARGKNLGSKDILNKKKHKSKKHKSKKHKSKKHKSKKYKSKKHKSKKHKSKKH